MTCQQISQFLVDYVSGDLPASQLEEFEHHIARCPDCRNYIDGYRKSIALSRTVLIEDTASMPEDLVTAILRTCRRPER